MQRGDIRAKSGLRPHVSLSPFPAYQCSAPAYLKCLPFWWRVSKALAKVYNPIGSKEFNDKNSNPVALEVGYVTAKDTGFRELRQIIELERPNLKSIKEIGLAYGCLPLEGTFHKPNQMIYVTIQEGDNERWEHVIFGPFDPDKVYDLTRWARESATRRVASWALCLVVIWTVIMVFLVFN